ncbi:DUF4232 domain-containing protein [Streptomyces hiroshimensis]|uniref:DUF4232 domain-containing protein n=1 Tax=Streptomyces hiroshimensis TaxID=66424 RepID=A0ABQ2YAM5_9ACTN|nr:DUF4232 domain-containing protein [Streptomyces hiroshimensis]GGX74901.1 hypothetical protein GCM10010324_20330 [Streptomyces hiroshimensis]
MRTSRTRTTAAAAATATAALALAMTAVGGALAATGGDGGTDGAAPRSMAAFQAAAKPKAGESRPGKPRPEPKVSQSLPEYPSSTEVPVPYPSSTVRAPKAVTLKAALVKAVGAKAAPAKAVPDVRQCDGTEMSYSVLHRFPGERGEHLLITAKNTDAKPCWVTSYPSVMLGDSVNVLPHSGKDAPGGNTRITVRPGGKVYSAVALFSDNVNTHTSEDFSIAMRDHTGDTGPAAEQTSFGSDGTPSKFTWSEASVLNWNTAKPYDF